MCHPCLQGLRFALGATASVEGDTFIINGEIESFSNRFGQYIIDVCMAFDNHMLMNHGTDNGGCMWDCNK